MSAPADPIFQEGFRQGVQAAIAMVEGRASMAVEQRRTVEGEALDLAARQLRRQLLDEPGQGGVR